MLTVWKHPTPALPTPSDRYEYQAKRCKRAGWHPSLLLDEAEVAALHVALESEEGKAWLEAKGESEKMLSLALLRTFIKHSLEDPRPALPAHEPWAPTESREPAPIFVRRFVRRSNESAREQYERRAQEWCLAGRPDELLVDSYRLVALRCWVGSDGGKKEPISTLLREYLEESDASLPLSYSMTLGDHQHCGACGEMYRVENLMLCTNCTYLWCHRCIYGGKTPKHPNGNYACGCKIGELVG